MQNPYKEELDRLVKDPKSDIFDKMVALLKCEIWELGYMEGYEDGIKSYS